MTLSKQELEYILNILLDQAVSIILYCNNNMYCLLTDSYTHWLWVVNSPLTTVQTCIFVPHPDPLIWFQEHFFFWYLKNRPVIGTVSVMT